MRRTRAGTFQISDQSPTITFAESVTCYLDAHKLAARDQWPLRVAEEAWQQMLDAGVAPHEKSDDVTLV